MSDKEKAERCATTLAASKKILQANYSKKSKLPPYGAALAERQKWRNFPFLVIVCSGVNAWQRAKEWQHSQSSHALVLPDSTRPAFFKWPVQDCLCIVEWDTGPSNRIIIELVERLLMHGAKSVTVQPVFADLTIDPWLYDTEKEIGHRWIQRREVLRTYHARGGIPNAA